MKQMSILTFLTAALVHNVGFAETIQNCTGADSSSKIEFQVRDSWDEAGSRSTILIHQPAVGEFPVIYSQMNTLVAASAVEKDMHGFPVSLLELTWSGFPEVSGSIKVGQGIRPRNHMGKYLEFNFQCVRQL
ncbi:MAG: hypothetical protein AB7N80_11925 [Bdellovibrionales bacterium]